MQMNVSLPQSVYEFVQNKIDSGIYSNESEIVCDALRRFNEDESRHEAWKVLTGLLKDADDSGVSSMSVSDVVTEVFDKRKT